MFKGILPKRAPDIAAFTMVTPPPDSAPNGKENRPDNKPKSFYKSLKGSPEPAHDMEQAFDQLLVRAALQRRSIR